MFNFGQFTIITVDLFIDFFTTKNDGQAKIEWDILKILLGFSAKLFLLAKLALYRQWQQETKELRVLQICREILFLRSYILTPEKIKYVNKRYKTIVKVMSQVILILSWNITLIIYKINYHTLH